MSDVYVIYKTFTDKHGRLVRVLVNDDEGVPYEFESFEKAKLIAETFEKNSKIGSTYTVR